jgi:hypothetical protein
MNVIKKRLCAHVIKKASDADREKYYNFLKKTLDENIDKLALDFAEYAQEEYPQHFEDTRGLEEDYMLYERVESYVYRHGYSSGDGYYKDQLNVDFSPEKCFGENVPLSDEEVREVEDDFWGSEEGGGEKLFLKIVQVIKIKSTIHASRKSKNRVK